MTTVVDLDGKGSDEEINTDKLDFQDIAHDGNVSLLEEDDGTMRGSKMHTHTFTNFPNPEEDSEDDDKADLLKGEKKSPSFWTFEYYQTYFDVETNQVMRRILGSMVPNPRSNYLHSQIRPNPDLYGPFWICTTLIFTTAIAGNMASYIQEARDDFEWEYDFHKVTFSASAIFGYWWVVPTILWGVLWWRGSQAGYTYSEIICVYGYSLAIYIPISILWVIPVAWLQWLLVIIGMAMSGTVLVITFWPAVKEDNKKIAMITMGMILLLHGLLAVGFVLYFFRVSDMSDVPPNANNSTTTHMADVIATTVKTLKTAAKG